MSFATMPAPFAVSAPPTAKLLLPTPRSPVAATVARPKRSLGSVRRSTSFAAGNAGSGSVVPTIGASHGVPGEASSASSAGGSSARMRPSASSRASVPRFRSRNME